MPALRNAERPMTKRATLPLDLPRQRRATRPNDLSQHSIGEANERTDNAADCDGVRLSADTATSLPAPFEVQATSEDAGEAMDAAPVETQALTAGEILLLDPANCVVSKANARDVTTLTFLSCEPLINAIITARGVIEPIVVRLTRDGRYEVLCGARRYWSVCWLRANGYPDMMLPAIVRDAHDEEAFRIAEVDHHGRHDLSAIERGQSYARALRRFYGNEQSRLAEALRIRKATVSVLVGLAGWSADVVAAYASPHDILEADAARVSPLLGRPGRSELVIAEARKLKAEQATKREAGDPPIDRAAVTARLLGAGRSDKGPLAVADADGEIIALMRSRAGEDGFAVVVRAVERRDPLVLGRALHLLVAQHAAGRRGTVQLSIESASSNLASSPDRRDDWNYSA